MRLILVNRLYNPKSHAKTIGNWQYVERFGVYAWKGEPMKPKEWNEFAASNEWKRQIELHGRMITVQCVEIKDMAKAREALLSKQGDATTANIR